MLSDHSCDNLRFTGWYMSQLVLRLHFKEAGDEWQHGTIVVQLIIAVIAVMFIVFCFQ